jgi:hypothetical protein
MENENGSTATPGGDAGQGAGDSGGQATVNYAGFETPEALAEAYTSKTSEMESLNEKIRNLESLRGHHGTEIGNLRTQLATMQGQLQTYQRMVPQNQGPTIQDIKAKLDRGDISDADAIELVHKITLSEAENKLKTHYEETFNKKINDFKSELAFEKYKEKFLSENKGYQEAFETGKLDKWISKGISGQNAWDKYQLELKNAELDSLKKQTAKQKEEAEKKGMEKGVKIEQGKAGASKVLNGKSSAFAQHQGNYDLTNPQQRREAGIARLNQIRTGAG